MKPADIFLFWFGHRGATERIAGSRAALGVGALLVLSAGIARNYDHLDLLREPEWVFGPFIVSIISAIIIFAFVALRLSLGKKGSLFPQFTSFLALFWMTAPLAWLYGIPVESFTDLVTATKYNISLLAVVSLWRVILMVRATTLLTGAPWWSCLLAILFPAVLETMVGAFQKNLSLVSIMGGVRLPPHHEIIQHATSTVLTVCFFLVVPLALFLVSIPRDRSKASRALGFSGSRTPPSTWLVAGFCICGWIAISTPFQPAIRNNKELERLLLDERFRDAIDFAATKGSEGFSSIHQLPPGTEHYRSMSILDEAIPELQDSDPLWLREIWVGQAIESLSYNSYSLSSEDAYEFLNRHDENYRILLEHESVLRTGIDKMRGTHEWKAAQVAELERQLKKAQNRLGKEAVEEPPTSEPDRIAE